MRNYVIGAFCDHSGHGTIYTDWKALDQALVGKEDRIETKKLRALLRIANANSGGDGIANILMLEAVLRDRDYSLNMLSNLYREYPCKLFKATVTNKNKFICNLDETKLTDPARL